MSVSEKQKQYARAWDRENMRTISCRLRTEDAEYFKDYCKAHKTNPAAVLKKYIFECLEKYSEELEAEEKNHGKIK